MKLEVEVPQGATKIDIGPILEPILARLVRLERRVGKYEDIDCGRDTSSKKFPVLPRRVEEWVAFAEADLKLTRRLMAIDSSVFRAYFQATAGWERPKHFSVEEDWRGITKERWCYYRSRDRADPYRHAAVHLDLKDGPIPEDEKIGHYYKVLEEIRKSLREEHYEWTPKDEVLTQVEQFAPVLIQLALAAPDEQED